MVWSIVLRFMKSDTLLAPLRERSRPGVTWLTMRLEVKEAPVELGLGLASPRADGLLVIAHLVEKSSRLPQVAEHPLNVH